MSRKSLKLYYVTNRNHEGDQPNNPKGYGIYPSKDGIENLRLGKVTLNVGQELLDKWFKKKTGSGPGDGVELSQDLAKLAKKNARIAAFRENNPHKQVTKGKQRKTKLGSHELRDEVQKAMREKRDVLLYVHGFNVSWWDAVGSALALQEMLNRPELSPEGKNDLLVILFTWPSDGSAIPLVSYGSDRTDAIGSGFALGRAFIKLRDFLAEATRTAIEKGKEEGIRQQLCNQNFNLLCHSMGNYVLQNAIQRLIERTEGSRLPRIFDHVFMCSPDVDDDVLEAGQPLGRVHEVCRNVNVYFNRGDLALRGSDYTKGNPDRLGTNGVARPSQLHQKIFQIDCSGDLVQGVLEHSYYLKGRINSDLRMSLDNGPQDDGRPSREPGSFPNTFIMK